MRLVVVAAALLVAAYTIGTFLISVELVESDQKRSRESRRRHQSSTSISPPKAAGPQRRFPQYGTAEFSRQCNWTVYRGNTRNCRFLARPAPREGIGFWIPQIVAGHMLAQQAGCDISFDYGPGVDLTEILLPPFRHEWNWTISHDYECETDPRCFDIVTMSSYNYRKQLDGIAGTIGTSLAGVPFYRFAYYSIRKADLLYTHHFRELQRALPGLQPVSGMACSVGSLFHLAPSVSQFEPDLFSRILPTLNREDSLVMAVYIRTGETDKAFEKEVEMQKGEANTTEGEYKDYRESARFVLECALQQEKEHLEGSSFTRVVWMVVTDSPALKQWITESYDTTRADAVGKSNNVTREIVTTRARGVHTRTQRDPSTFDFAQAFIDWYLIGESDLVIMGGGSPSFGGTAALRTARPVYDASKATCFRAVPIHENVTVTTRLIKRKSQTKPI